MVASEGMDRQDACMGHNDAVDGLASVRKAFALLDAVAAEGLLPWPVPVHTEALGQANVVFADRSGALVAASDPRADGAASVTQFPRRDR